MNLQNQNHKLDDFFKKLYSMQKILKTIKKYLNFLSFLLFFKLEL